VSHRRVKVVQGHSRSSILVLTESPYAIYLPLVSSNLSRHSSVPLLWGYCDANVGNLRVLPFLSTPV